MSFHGYSRDAVTLLRDLKANNTKAWFEANRPRFDELVMAPSVDLVGALAEPLSRLSPPLKAAPKNDGSIRRIFRDTRFSKDKTPYHRHLHLVFWTGDHPNRSPGVNIVLADDHLDRPAVRTDNVSIVVLHSLGAIVHMSNAIGSAA